MTIRSTRSDAEVTDLANVPWFSPDDVVVVSRRVGDWGRTTRDGIEHRAESTRLRVAEPRTYTAGYDQVIAITSIAIVQAKCERRDRPAVGPKADDHRFSRSIGLDLEPCVAAPARVISAAASLRDHPFLPAACHDPPELLTLTREDGGLDSMMLAGGVCSEKPVVEHRTTLLERCIHQYPALMLEQVERDEGDGPPSSRRDAPVVQKPFREEQLASRIHLALREGSLANG